MRPASSVLQEAWRNPAGRVGAILLLVITLSAVVGPWFLPDPLAQPDILAGSLPPGLGHPFGTDQLNRDVLARVVTGARVSLSVALLAVGLSVTIGAAVGLVSGYWGGVVDAGLMRLVDGALALVALRETAARARANMQRDEFPSYPSNRSRLRAVPSDRSTSDTQPSCTRTRRAV